MLGLSKDEFKALLDEGKAVATRPSSKANWEQIIANCKEGQGQDPFSRKQFYVTYVEGVVTQSRSDRKLEQLVVQKRLLKVQSPYNSAYYYMWPESEL